jgi:xylose isomerase
MGRFDQDFRFASEDPKRAFFVVKLLEESGYDGSRHFDAKAYRTEDEEGVWAFARGCMRSYLILKDKARRFAADPEIQGVIAELRQQDGAYDGPSASDGYARERGEALKNRTFDAAALARRGRRNEQLDQLVMELLLGVR